MNSVGACVFHLPYRLVPHHCCSVDRELAGSGQQISSNDEASNEKRMT